MHHARVVVQESESFRELEEAMSDLDVFEFEVGKFGGYGGQVVGAAEDVGETGVAWLGAEGQAVPRLLQTRLHSQHPRVPQSATGKGGAIIRMPHFLLR